MTMRGAIVVSVLATAMLGAPVGAQSDASPIAATAEAINGDGLAAFARLRAGDWDVAESPLLTWYVHRFMTLREPDPRARALLAELRAAGVSVEGRMTARRGASSYTEAVAENERSVLGLETQWEPPPPILAWTADITIRTDDARPGTSSTDAAAAVTAPFYERDGVRGVRLMSADGSRALYAFFGEAATITGLRTRLTPSLWQSMRREFSPSLVDLENWSVDLETNSRFDADPAEGFGSFASRVRTRAGSGELRFTVSPGELKLALRAYVEGLALNVLGESIHADPAGLMPVVHRLGTTTAVLYVVADTRTGVILLLGEHL